MKTFSMNQLGRYPIYLKYFKELSDEGVETISSPRIAAKLGYSEEQVRKDLQNVSLEPGRPKKGRSLKQLIEDIETFLGYRDTSLVGTSIGGKRIFSLDELKTMLPRLNAHIAIITVPASVAQEVCDLAISSGAKALWNFAPTHLDVPSNIVVENVNLASSLAVLSHRLNIALAKQEEK